MALILVAAVTACATSPEIGSTTRYRAAVDESHAGLSPHLVEGAVIFLGELHGTAEAPAFVGRAVELALHKGLSVTVALEIFGTESERVDAFLASGGDESDRAALLSGQFWQRSYQDGRASDAMLNLIEDLREHVAGGHTLRVVCFDRPGGRGFERERAMADALVTAIAEAPEDMTLVLSGDIHAKLARGAGRGISEPMALQVAERLPDTRILSLRLSYSGGTAWICGPGIPGGCGETEVVGRDPDTTPHVVVNETPKLGGFNGEFHVGEIHAALPAVEEHRPSMTVAPVERNADAMSHPGPQVAAVAPRPLSPVPLIGDWPQWMGPRRDGSLEPGLLPLGVSIDLEVDWRRPIGRGYSSVSVSGNLGLTLEADERNLWAVGFDVTDGRETWRVALGDAVPEGSRPPETPPSTPTTDGRHVFAISAEGGLFALDASDGAILWERDLVEDFGASPPSYGMSTSPVLAEGRLFVLVGGREGFNLVAFDPASGEVLTHLGPATKASYSTPAVGMFADQQQLVVPAADRLYGLGLDGETPVWSHEGIPYPDRSPLLLEQGRIFLAFQEYGAMFEVSPESWTVRELWRADRLGNSYSPTVYRDGALFGLGSGHLMSLDADTGKINWQQRLVAGSLLRIDDHLAVFDSMGGTLRLVPATPDGYSEVARLQVFPPGQNGPAAPSFGAGRIFIRGAGEIAAVRLDLR